MKLVHIASYRTGGAGIASLRIHSKILQQGLNSKIYFLEDFQNKNPLTSIFSRILHYLKRRLFENKSFLKDEFLFLNNKELVVEGLNSSLINSIDSADVIFIHWVSNNLNTYDILKLFKKTNARIIFIMMDMAHITGGCHYSRNCINYRINCIDCPALVYTQKIIAHNQQLSKSLNISKFKVKIIEFFVIDLINAKK